MSLAPREKRTVLIGAAAVILVLGYLYVARPVLAHLRGSGARSAQQQGNQFKQARLRVGEFTAVTAELDKLKTALRVEVSQAAASEQMQKIIEKFESLSGRANVRITNIQQLKTKARTATTARGPVSTAIELQLNAENFASIWQFLDSLEQESVPIVCDQINITATGGRGGPEGGGSPGGPPNPRGRGGSQKRQIQANLKIHTYLFPEKAEP